jgi:hypothetical protein
MSDIDSSLPIKSEVDADEYVRVKLYDSTATNPMEIDSDNDGHVKAKLRDDSGAAFGTEANPVFVAGAEDPGDEIEDYQTTVDLAKNSTSNHDYTVTTAKTFKGLTLFVSASGEFKVELQKETAAASGIYNTLYVGFAQASSPYLQIDLKKVFKQVADAKVRVKIENRDNQQDVYSTLVGIEA